MEDKLKALVQLIGLISQGFTAGIPVFGILKGGFDAIKAGLEARGIEAVNEALDKAAQEDLEIIARARLEQQATE